MASLAPFATSAAATTGKTVKVSANATPTSVAGSLVCTNTLATNVLVTNTGTVAVFVRLSPQATPTATASDVPMPPNSSRVFANPVPNGTLGLAVLSSAAVAADIYFTPGTGGI